MAPPVSLLWQLSRWREGRRGIMWWCGAGILMFLVMLWFREPNREAKGAVDRILGPLPPGVSIVKGECVESGINATFTCTLRYSSNQALKAFLDTRGVTETGEKSYPDGDGYIHKGFFRGGSYHMKASVGVSEAFVIMEKN